MPSFFISHSSADAAEAAALCSCLEAAGYPQPFVSSEPDHTITAGHRWENELYRQLQARDAVIFVGTTASAQSRWCFAELAFARAFGKRIFPVWAGDAWEPHPLLGDVHGVRLLPDRDSGYRRLLRDLEAAGLAPGDGYIWQSGGNPYPGLRSFAVEEAGVFFGRTHEAADLERRLRLRPVTPTQAFLVVTGPSGCGKSSLVRAGLLPRLHRARGEWLVVDPFVPGARPVDGLARALVSTALRDGVKWAWREVATDTLADRLWDLVMARGLDQADAKVLLVIDQLEELLRADPGERARFAELIKATLTGGEVPLRVLATLRSGSIRPAMEEPALVALLQNQMVVSGLERPQLRDVIEGPARVAAIALAPGLTDRVLNEAVGTDALPMLAFTLRRLVEKAAEPGRVTVADYERTGGVIRALELTADETFARAEAQFGRELVVTALLSLVTFDAAGEPMRQRVVVAGLDDTSRVILEHFVEARLLTSDETAVEVAHEALFRVWRPLRLLTEEHRSELEIGAQLLRAAGDWQRADRRSSYMIRGDRLVAAQSWLDRHDTSATVRAFVEASLREDAAMRERQADQLASLVLRDHHDDPELGVLLALAAIDTYAQTPRTLLALSAALEGWRVERIFPTGDWVHIAVPSPDSSLVAALTSERVLLFEMSTGEQLATLELPSSGSMIENSQALVWTPDGRFVIAGQPGAVTVWDVAHKRLERTLEVGDAQAADLAVSPDGAVLACATDNGFVSLWQLEDLGTPPVRFQVDSRKATAVAFSPDGRRLIIGARHQASVWALDPLAELWSMDHFITVWAVDWSSAGPWIATTDEGAVRLLDAEDRQQLSTLPTRSFGLCYGPDGQLATTDGELVIWDDPLQSGEPRRFQGRKVGRHPRFTTAGQRIVLDHELEGVWVWDVRPPGPELALGQDVMAACFAGAYVVTRERKTISVYDDGMQVGSWQAKEDLFPRIDATPDGRLLVTDHPDGARLWRLPDGALIRHLADGWPRFSADGRLLLLYGKEGDCEVWSTNPLERQHEFSVADNSLWTADLVLDGRAVVTCGSERVSIWDVENGTLVRHLTDVVGFGPQVSAASDGLHIAVCPSRAEWATTIWDVRSGERLLLLPRVRFNTRSAYPPLPVSVAFAPDGGRLALASDDGSVQVWDAARGELVQLIAVTSSRARSARFSPDGLKLVTTQHEGPAKVWLASPADVLVARARERSFRALTHEERTEYGL